jgi:predicted  nucleic acid-binding Zn-ribbon protein
MIYWWMCQDCGNVFPRESKKEPRGPCPACGKRGIKTLHTPEADKKALERENGRLRGGLTSIRDFNLPVEALKHLASEALKGKA